MESTVLIDGRRVAAEPCLGLELALVGSTYTKWPYLYEIKDVWYVECQCCAGAEQHSWSPSGYGVDPNGGHYSCGPCCGAGKFKIQMP